MVKKKVVNLQSQIERNGVGPVVQLVRMPPCHGGGRGFESRPDRKVQAKTILKPLKVSLSEAFLILSIVNKLN